MSSHAAPGRFGELIVEGELIKSPNSRIWRARTPAGDPVAIKELKVHRADREPYHRFRDELAFHHAGPHPGVLPVIASALPEDPSAEHPAWLATPQAVVVLEALGPEPDLDKVIQAVHAYAQTLARLAEKQIFHRDLKPANLFWLNGEWMVGDFGLVHFPGKQQVTEATAKLGPANFLAPEMIDNPLAADPGPADVWALAKTLWALAAGRPWPAQGPLLRDSPYTGLSHHVSHPRAYALEPILELATAYGPTDRVTMATFTDELSAWLAGPASSGSVEGTEDLAARMSTLAEPGNRATARQDQLMEEAGAAFARLCHGPGQLQHQMAKLGNLHIDQQGLLRHIGAGTRRRDIVATGEAAWIIAAPNSRTIGIHFEVAYELFGPELIHLAAGAFVRNGDALPEVLWLKTRQAPPGTTLAERSATELADLMTHSFRNDAQRYVELAEAAQQAAQARRQPPLVATGITYEFRTEPQAGIIAIYRRADGSRDGYATAWSGTPLVHIEADGDRLLVRTRTHEGWVDRLSSGYWALTSDQELDGAGNG